MRINKHLPEMGAAPLDLIESLLLCVAVCCVRVRCSAPTQLYARCTVESAVCIAIQSATAYVQMHCNLCTIEDD